jgi:chitin disaccharide deacetylase
MMSGADGRGCRVVFHADDLGMNEAVNQGIFRALRQGLLTSTSLLVNAPSAEAACQEWPTIIAEHQSAKLESAEFRRELGDPDAPFDLGIHLNLSQGRPLTGERFPVELLDDRGDFPGIGTIFQRLGRARSEQLAAVRTELQTQIEWMCDRGLRPTHLNGHQYVELIPPVAAMVPSLLVRYSIPVVRVARETGLVRSVLFRGRVVDWGLAIVKRYFANAFRQRVTLANAAFPDRFFGTSHAGRVDLQTVRQFLRRSPVPVLTEIGVHPGELNTDDLSQNDPWHDPLRQLRPRELECLCGVSLRDLLVARGYRLGRLHSLAGTSHR